MAPSLSRPVRVELAAAHTNPAPLSQERPTSCSLAWPTWQPGRRWLPCCPITAARLQQPAHAAQQVQAGIQRCLGCGRLEAVPRRSCLGVHHKLLHRVVCPEQLRSTLGNRSWKVRRGRRGPVSWRCAGHEAGNQAAGSLLGSRTRATPALAAAQQTAGLHRPAHKPLRPPASRRRSSGTPTGLCKPRCNSSLPGGAADRASKAAGKGCSCCRSTSRAEAAKARRPGCPTTLQAVGCRATPLYVLVSSQKA